jgi:MYXO-CTERM domain-containing protein
MVLAAPAVASAGDHASVVLKLQDGLGGPFDDILNGEIENGRDYAGAGAEQATVAWEEVYDATGALVETDIVTVWMSSDVSQEDRPWQLKCSVTGMYKEGEPTLLVDQMQITSLGDPNNADERPANHPHIASRSLAPGKKLISMCSDDNNGNVQTYVAVLDARSCQLDTEWLRISNNNNNNQGAPDCVVTDGNRAVCGYYDNNDQRMYARGITYDPATNTLAKDWLTVVVTPSNIGRPTVAQPSADRTFLCAAKGNNRPPEMGVECALLNSLTGEIQFKSYIQESTPPTLYFNQPQVAMLDNGEIAVYTNSSSGDGKNTNDKGETESYLNVVNVTDAGMQIKTLERNVGMHQVHSGMCAARFGAVASGETAPMHAVISEGPVTGAGQPAVMFVEYDAVAKNLVVDMNYKFYTSGWYADSGYLQNIYGQNPNTQGREFFRCAGNIPNPAYQVPGGYKSTVKSFVAAPHAGRQYENFELEPKNAMYLSLVPAETEVVAPPEAPEAPTKPPVGPGGSQNPPGGEPPPSEDPDGSGWTPGLPQSSSGCSVGGQDAGLGFVLIALGLGAIAGRRRREV